MAKIGQSAVEFLLIVSAVILFVAGFLAILNHNAMLSYKEKYSAELLRVANDIKDEISLAYDAGDGYYRNFDLPSQIINLNYNVTMLQGNIYLQTQNSGYALLIPVFNASGDVHPGANTIRKFNGTIYLNS